MNNQFLGNMKEVRVDKPFSARMLLFIFGNIVGFIPFLFLLTIKSSAAVLIWNTFVAPNGFDLINFSTAFGAISILTLATIRYSGRSVVENFIDFGIKVIFLVLLTQTYSYFI